MTSEQLEREAEQTRAAFEQTLDELRARITPGHVVDQLVDYARGGPAGAFFHNLGRRTVDNPMPLLVIGAGVAWLMIANGSSSGSTGGSTGGSMVDRMSGDRAATAGERIVGAAGSATSAVGDLAHRAKARIGDATGMNEPAEPQLGQTEARSDGFVDFFREHPVVLVGLGLAIGAAIGAAITPARGQAGEEEAAKERVGHMGEAVQAGTTARAHDGSGRTNGSGGAAREAPMAGQ